MPWILTIGNFLKKLELKDILWVVAIVLAVLLLKQCSTIGELKEKAKMNEQNAIALTDSIHTERSNHSRTFNAYKAAMVADKDQLKKLNFDLYNKLDSLQRVKRVKGDLLTFHDVGIGISGDTGTVEATVLYVSPNGDIRLSFQRDTAFDEYNSRGIAGHMDFHIDSLEVSNATMTITRDDIAMSLSTGITEDDGTYKIFVSSDFPGFKVTKLDGAVLDPKALRKIASDESSIVIGPQFSYGYALGSRSPSPFIGLGVTYNVNKPVKQLFR